MKTLVFFPRLTGETLWRFQTGQRLPVMINHYFTTNDLKHLSTDIITNTLMALLRFQNENAFRVVTS